MKSFNRLLREAYRRGYSRALNEGRKGYKVNFGPPTPSHELLNCLAENIIMDYMGKAEEMIYGDNRSESPRIPEHKRNSRETLEAINSKLFDLLSTNGYNIRYEVLRDFIDVKGFSLSGVLYRVAENFLSGQYYTADEVLDDNELPPVQKKLSEVIKNIKNTYGEKPSINDIENGEFLQEFCGVIKRYIEFTIEGVLVLNHRYSRRYYDVLLLGDDEVYETLRNGIWTGLMGK